MHHDINKKKIFNVFKKSRITIEIADYCCRGKIVNNGSFILHQQQVVYRCINTIKTLAW